ncbi:NAD(P)H quinone oxidoreductase, PIG3 family [Conidiobolus coronatus NRRL 28638]|uniref:NAD(P)H quinone oxidoreductase, PIG3 family n=1 Tax=Conidiobolus coronatus (strain ATCC 28846 / CBS 209.66 / NRRL 28638) TaxID=796925 RepID=A0A137PGE5_CONC2|nr:NAD(P)H quinone oxidoreductase, PIG3 family [Conidiobolus coronatus NRRL 28638]|eukprot:KXN74058.1 NAD(P)H quinone oxidoreductase, PIG3 family [Conidiobolus coronatus NRRL 28638]
MKAIVQDQFGGIETLLFKDIATPEPKEKEVLVKVKAFGINRMDIVQRLGKYPPPPGASEIIGVEVSGEIAKVGSQVTKYQVGQEVFGLMGGGAYAEYAIIHEDLAILKPKELSFIQAATIPEVWFTAYQALHLVGNIKQGDDVLIHAGASGVGLSAIQLAKRAGARNVYVTAGSADKIEFCKSYGATQGFNYKETNFNEEILKVTENRGVDLIIDFIGGSYWNNNINSLALDGRLVILGTMGGPNVSETNIGVILRKRLRVQGSTLRSRTVEYQSKLAKVISDEIAPAIISGELKHNICKEFDWNQIGEAHNYMEQANNIGKIVATIN